MAVLVTKYISGIPSSFVQSQESTNRNMPLFKSSDNGGAGKKMFSSHYWSYSFFLWLIAKCNCLTESHSVPLFL